MNAPTGRFDRPAVGSGRVVERAGRLVAGRHLGRAHERAVAVEPGDVDGKADVLHLERDAARVDLATHVEQHAVSVAEPVQAAHPVRAAHVDRPGPIPDGDGSDREWAAAPERERRCEHEHEQSTRAAAARHAGAMASRRRRAPDYAAGGESKSGHLGR